MAHTGSLTAAVVFYTLQQPACAAQDSPVSDPCWPLDHDLFTACAADTIRRLRCHVCVALWCGGNEQRPSPDLDAALRRMLPVSPGGHEGSRGYPGVCTVPLACTAGTHMSTVDCSLVTDRLSHCFPCSPISCHVSRVLIPCALSAQGPALTAC